LGNLKKDRETHNEIHSPTETQTQAGGGDRAPVKKFFCHREKKKSKQKKKGERKDIYSNNSVGAKEQPVVKEGQTNGDVR